MSIRHITRHSRHFAFSGALFRITEPSATATIELAAPTDRGEGEEPEALLDRANLATDPAEVAGLVSEAYYALSPDERTTEVGAHLVLSALTEFQEARDHDSCETGEATARCTALLRAEKQLLEDFMRARPSQPIPPRFKAEHSTVSMLLESAVPAVPAVPPHQDPPLPTRQRDVVRPERERATVETRPQATRSSAAKTSLALGLGAASVAAGAVVAGLGGWVFAETNERRDRYINTAAVHASERMLRVDSMGLEQAQEDLRRFEQGSRRRAAALVTVGAALTAAGVGVVAWGVARAARRQPRSKNTQVGLVPAVNARRIGLGLHAKF